MTKLENNCRYSGVKKARLVVEPTHLKNMGQLGSFFSRDRGEEQKYLSCHHLETCLTGQIRNISPTYVSLK